MIPVNCSIVSGVALSIINGEAKIALMKRAKEGFWCHVAGKVEPGETGWQAIVREFFEETQIVVKALYNGEYIEQFYEPGKNQIELIPVFVAVCPPEQPIVLNLEHTEYRWCSLEEAKSLAPFPNQRALYDHIWKYFVIEKSSSHMEIKVT